MQGSIRVTHVLLLLRLKIKIQLFHFFTNGYMGGRIVWDYNPIRPQLIFELCLDADLQTNKFSYLVKQMESRVHQRAYYLAEVENSEFQNQLFETSEFEISEFENSEFEDLDFEKLKFENLEFETSEIENSEFENS